MSNSHLIQYVIIGIIAVAVVVAIVKRWVKIRQCDNQGGDMCECCSAKSLCGKKKNGKGVAESGK